MGYKLNGKNDNSIYQMLWNRMKMQILQFISYSWHNGVNRASI